MREDVITKFKEITFQVDNLLKQIDNIKQSGIADALSIVDDAYKGVSVQEKIVEIDKAIETIENIKKIKSLFIAYGRNSNYEFQNIQDLLQGGLEIIVLEDDILVFLENQKIINIKVVSKGEVANELKKANTVFVAPKIPKNVREDNMIISLDYEDADEVLHACASIVYVLHQQLWGESIDD